MHHVTKRSISHAQINLMFVSPPLNTHPQPSQLLCHHHHSPPTHDHLTFSATIPPRIRHGREVRASAAMWDFDQDESENVRGSSSERSRCATVPTEMLDTKPLLSHARAHTNKHTHTRAREWMTRLSG